jgi:uncharacterized protein RhaS with RHS repeats
MHARYYTASMGRFLSVDPGRDGWNLYAYVGNNPVSSIDPDGRERAQILLDQDIKRFLAGEISEEQYIQNLAARGSGAITVASLFVPGPEDVALAGFIATKVGGRLAGVASRALGKASGSIGKGLRRLFGKADDAAEAAANTAKSGGRGSNNLKPDSNAQGPHSTFKRDGDGNLTNHAEWQPNPRNPSGFDEAKRIDLVGDPHYNKISGQEVQTPHTHGKDIPGGVRPAKPEEIPGS